MSTIKTIFARPPVCSIGSITKGRLPVTSAIEGTVLDKNASDETIDTLCKAAVSHGWKGVCVFPKHIGQVSRLLKGSSVIPVSVVGFPDGNIDTGQKIADVKKAVSNGAREVDMVIKTDALKAGRDKEVKEDIRRVARAAHSRGAALKVILEAGTLTDEEISRGSKLAIQGGADFLKRSTGFEPEERKIKDDSVRYHQLDLMKSEIARSNWKKRSHVRVKDSGQIKTLQTATGSLEHGASRLGIGFESALSISGEEKKTTVRQAA